MSKETEELYYRVVLGAAAFTVAVLFVVLVRIFE